MKLMELCVDFINMSLLYSLSRDTSSWAEWWSFSYKVVSLSQISSYMNLCCTTLVFYVNTWIWVRADTHIWNFYPKNQKSNIMD